MRYGPKMGFSIPLGRGCRGPLKARVQESRRCGRLADTNFFNLSYLEELVRDHNNSSRDYSASIWTILIFEAFLRNVLEAGDPA